MLTPQEAEGHVFPKASFGGYNMLQVDTFLDTLIEDYGTLYKENIALKSKMKVLVDKIEEYRATEDAMRMTLHSAQKMADAMVKEGEARKNAAIEEAVSEVKKKGDEVKAELERQEQAIRDRIAAAQRELEDEQARITAARASTTAYVSRLKELYAHEVEYIGSLSGMTAEALSKKTQAPPQEVPPAQEKKQAAVAQEIEASMTKIFDDPKDQAEGEKPAEDKPAEDKPAQAREDPGETKAFPPIQYGKDYEIE